MQEQSDETKQSSESHLDMTQMLELSNRKFKNTLRALMEKIGNMQ